jgi:hypothetical protein
VAPTTAHLMSHCLNFDSDIHSEEATDTQLRWRAKSGGHKEYHGHPARDKSLFFLIVGALGGIRAFGTGAGVAVVVPACIAEEFLFNQQNLIDDPFEFLPKH